MDNSSEWYKKLEGILAAHVAQSSLGDPPIEEAKDKLVGASFMVINKDGKLIDERMTKEWAPGQVDGQLMVLGQLFSGSAGRTSQDSNSESWTIHTFAWLASLTKLPSAICLLQLVERGYLSLDEDLRSRFRETGLDHLASVQVLRGFTTDSQPILEPNTRPITLRHLLTHTCGLTYDLPSEDLMKWRRAVGKQKNNLTWTVEGFSTPLLFEPGSAWLYGTGVDWATLLLEKVTGKPLGEYMEAYVFRPVGMRNSVFRPDKMPGRGEGRAPDLVNVLFREQDGTLHDMRPQPIPAFGEHELESGGAGLFSTTFEYSKVLQSILEGSLLSEDSTELLFKPQLDDRLQENMMDKVASNPEFVPEYPSGMPANFALGGMVNLEDIPGKRKAGSITWSGMSNCRWWIDKTTGIAGLMVVSVLPYGDPVANRLFDKLERAVYEDLRIHT